MQYKVTVNGGRRHWTVNGELHNEDGPAVEFLSKQQGPDEYWLFGERIWTVADYRRRVAELRRKQNTSQRIGKPVEEWEIATNVGWGKDCFRLVVPRDRDKCYIRVVDSNDYQCCMIPVPRPHEPINVPAAIYDPLRTLCDLLRSQANDAKPNAEEVIRRLSAASGTAPEYVNTGEVVADLRDKSATNACEEVAKSPAVQQPPNVQKPRHRVVSFDSNIMTEVDFSNLVDKILRDIIGAQEVVPQEAPEADNGTTEQEIAEEPESQFVAANGSTTVIVDMEGSHLKAGSEVTFSVQGDNSLLLTFSRPDNPCEPYRIGRLRSVSLQNGAIHGCPKGEMHRQQFAHLVEAHTDTVTGEIVPAWYLPGSVNKYFTDVRISLE